MVKAKLKDQLDKLIKTYKTAQMVSKEAYARSSLEKKRAIIDETKKLLRMYKTLILLDNTNVPSKLYTYLRQNYGHIFCVKMIKNTLLFKALKELGAKNVERLAEYLKGSTIALFTNLNAFEAKLILDKVIVPYKIKPGERIEDEIIVPPMKTELKPGPIMSLFGKLKVPIQVRDGVIWIMRESTIARPGDIATPELVSLFDKLGIEPRFLKPKIKIAYEDGLAIPVDQLYIDIENTKNSILDSVRIALSLAAELVIPEPNIVSLAISKAYIKACSLAVELGIIAKDTASMVFVAALRRAYSLAYVLSQKIPELASAVPQIAVFQPTIEIKEEKAVISSGEGKEEGKTEVSEEQLAEGLATLFG